MLAQLAGGPAPAPAELLPSQQPWRKQLSPTVCESLKSNLRLSDTVTPPSSWVSIDGEPSPPQGRTLHVSESCGQALR